MNSSTVGVAATRRAFAKLNGASAVFQVLDAAVGGYTTVWGSPGPWKHTLEKVNPERYNDFLKVAL